MKVLVDFWAPWCGPCIQMKPIISEIEAEGKVSVQRVNADENPQMAQQYKVRALPTLVYVENGKEVARHTGFANKETIYQLCRV